MRWAAHQNDVVEHPALSLGTRRVVKRRMCVTECKRVIQTNVQASGFSRSSKGETRRLIGDVHDWGYIRANAAHQLDANTEASGHSHMAGNSHVDYGGTIYRGAN